MIISRSPSCSWSALATMRKRGQRPADGVWITDHYAQRRNLEASGAFCVFPPEEGEEYLLVGLETLLIADRCERMVEIAQRIAAAKPRSFAVLFRGTPVQVVV